MLKNPHKIIGGWTGNFATLGAALMDLGNSLAYWVQEQMTTG